MSLEVIRARCAGMDVHKRQVTVCAHVPGRKELREFDTDTGSLLTMVDWLQELKIDDVAMEGTGCYWKPLYNLLEAAGLRPIVGNASHMKAVPGRKTDAKDAEWICDLHRHGLMKACLIPARVAGRAAMAVGQHILQSAYCIVRDGVTYRELGANYYDERRKEAVRRSALKRLARLGYTVTVTAATA